MAKAAESSSKKSATRGSATRSTRSRSASSKPRAATGSADSTGGSERASAKAVDKIIEVLQSPLVADLLAVGAMAAVTAIAERMTGDDRQNPGETSRKLVKTAAKAAATAIGTRLVTEFGSKGVSSGSGSAGA